MSDDVEVKKISEIIEPIIGEGTVESLDDFIESLEELKRKHTTSVYSEFEVTAAHKGGAGVLLLHGKRDETDEERKVREAREGAERRNIEQAELKEYLRLKKKYGKKDE